MVGQTVSHYRVLAKLGSGGMGVVYKAEDLKLGRAVALKFLPSHLTESEEHKARFLHEARAAALLDHPNICTVYEIDEAEGQTFLAMACLEGQTLKQKIGVRPLPLSEALDIAMQIGQGLQAAHEKGIIHRDIKPANIMITPQGQVKIMDFGLAQLSGRTKLTASGMKLGTPAYMPPEQTEGKATDRRSDIWALGVVLYEMISGRVPFAGDSEAAVAYAILHTEPEPLTALRSGVPVELDRITAKALAKDPAERYQHTDDVLADLRAASRLYEKASPSPTKQVARRRARRRTLLVVAATVTIVALGATVYHWPKSALVDPSRWTQVTRFPDSATQPALSADGRLLTFIRGESTFFGPGQVFAKVLPDGEPVQLTRDETEKMSPVFSPDGSRVAYTTVDQNVIWNTWEVPVLGGQPRLWLPNASGLIWTGPDRILFSEIKTGYHMGLMKATTSRAEASEVYFPAKQSGMAHRSYLSPDGKWVLLAEMVGQWLQCRVVPFDGSSNGSPVGPDGACTSAAWSPDGEWMYFSAHVDGAFHTWRQRFPGGVPEQVTAGPTEEEGLAVNPDGRSLLTSVGTRQSSVWIHEPRGEREVLMEGYAYVLQLIDVYTPPFFEDGRKFIFLLSRSAGGHVNWQGRPLGELWSVDIDSGRPEPLLPGFAIANYALSPDGDQIVVVRQDPAGERSMWLVSLARRSPPRKLPVPASAVTPHFSDDGSVYFRFGDGGLNYMARLAVDDAEWTKVREEPIQELIAISPNGDWAIVKLAAEAGLYTAALPLAGGPPRKLCFNCLSGWSADGRVLYLYLQKGTQGSGPKSYLIELPPGEVLPETPAEGIREEKDLEGLPVARAVAGEVYFGPDPDVYVYSRQRVQRNIYRIPLP